MPRIESISSLRDHSREISEFCHKEQEPVYLTTNGKGDLVVLSVEHFEQIQAELDLLAKLGTAQAEEARGEKGLSHQEMMKRLQSEIDRRAR
jgi:prevent-host-death family protein